MSFLNPRMPIVLSVVAGTSLLTLGGPATGVLAASHPPRSARATARCPSVKGAKLVKKTAQFRIFTQSFSTGSLANDDKQKGTRLLGCVLPRGKVVKLGENSQSYFVTGAGDRPFVQGFETAKLAQIAGTFVQVETGGGNDTGDHERQLRVVNLATGQHYVYGREATYDGDGYPPLPSRALLNDRGQSALIYVNPNPMSDTFISDPPPGATEVVIFKADGKRTILDSAPSAEIPVESLNLNGDVVSWTHSGQARTATIRGEDQPDS